MIELSDARTDRRRVPGPALRLAAVEAGAPERTELLRVKIDRSPGYFFIGRWRAALATDEPPCYKQSSPSRQGYECALHHPGL